MKKLFVLFFAAVFLFSACKKQVVSGGVLVTVPADSAARLAYRGVFSSGPYGTTMGVAKVYESAGMYKLVLDSFSVTTGPDLHVYLSKEVQPLNFIDLGVLRANSGAQEYPINGMPDFLQFRNALIHCQQYDHLFGSANLQ